MLRTAQSQSQFQESANMNFQTCRLKDVDHLPVSTNAQTLPRSRLASDVSLESSISSDTSVSSNCSVLTAQISNSPNEPYLWKTNSFGPLSMNNFESHVPSAESMARDMGSHLSTRLGEHSSSGSTADSALLDNPMPWDLFDTMDYTMTPTTSHHSDTIDPLAFDFSYNSGVESYQDRSDTPTMLTEEDMRTSYQQSLQHHHHQQMHTQWDVPRTGSQPQAATVAPSDTTHGSVKLEAAGTEFSYSLSHAERMRPTAIALLATKATAGNHDESGSTEASPKSSTATNNAADQTQSPAVSPTSSRRASNQIPKRSMRKESTHSSSASGSNSNHSTTKTTHNMIEKRYRTNLNDKIAALRDSVPSLRVAAARVDLFENGGKVQPSQQEDLGGLTPANKLNKATVLTKAVEYIAFLEQKVRRLERGNRDLKRLIATS